MKKFQYPDLDSNGLVRAIDFLNVTKTALRVCYEVSQAGTIGTFHVQVADNVNFTGTLLADDESIAASRLYLDVTGLTADTQYWARVRVKYGTGSYSAWSSVLTTKTNTDLKTWTNSAASSPTVGGFTANWAMDVTGDLDYIELETATDSGFLNIVSRYSTITKTDTSKVITGLIQGTTYYTRIRSLKTVIGRTYYGAWSNVISKQTASVTLPVLGTPTKDPSSVTIGWTATGGSVDVWEAQLFSDALCTSQYLVSEKLDIAVEQTEHSFLNLIKGRYYYYRVRGKKTIDSIDQYSEWAQGIVLIPEVESPINFGFEDAGDEYFTATWSKPVLGNANTGKIDLFNSSMERIAQLDVSDLTDESLLINSGLGSFFIQMQWFFDDGKGYVQYSDKSDLIAVDVEIIPPDMPEVSIESNSRINYAEILLTASTSSFDKYQIQLAYDIYFNQLLEDAEIEPGIEFTNYITTSHLAPGGMYYVRSRTIKNKLGSKYYGEWKEEQIIINGITSDPLWDDGSIWNDNNLEISFLVGKPECDEPEMEIAFDPNFTEMWATMKVLSFNMSLIPEQVFSHTVLYLRLRCKYIHPNDESIFDYSQWSDTGILTYVQS